MYRQVTKAEHSARIANNSAYYGGILSQIKYGQIAFLAAKYSAKISTKIAALGRICHSGGKFLQNSFSSVFWRKMLPV
jgi:hypothetical protein